MADAMTGKQQSRTSPTTNPPKQGEKFRCTKCGMEVAVTHDCKCSGNQHNQFTCCGQNMAKV